MKIEDGKRDVSNAKSKIEKITKDIEVVLNDLNTEYSRFEDERNALINELEIIKKTVREL